jgi:polyisoprenyl-phosphate glycosyltransferase
MENIRDLFVREKRPRGNLISMVLPVYNESASLPAVMDELFDYLKQAPPQYHFEMTFIDDGSTDASADLIIARAESAPANTRVSVCRLARNSGEHVAIIAGLNLARGDFTVVMSSDGQDPASVIGDLIQGWTEGADVVLAARRVNLDQSPVARWLSRMGWKIMSWSTGLSAPEKGCDFLGIDRRALEAFNRMDERNTTFIFRILSLGFRQKQIEYVKRARLGGRSSWNYGKKIFTLLDVVTGYSSRPLKLITAFGLMFFLLLVFRWAYLVFGIYVLGKTASDLTIVLNAVFTSLSIVILLLGLMGDYIWRILEEARKRPLYEISDVRGNIFFDLKDEPYE